MAIYTNAGGGGGLSPDDLTAEPGDVLKGKIAGVKGSDEPAAGTLELTGNASDSQVLAGSTYYNTNPKTKRTGTMVNQGAKTAALNAGGSYTIPAGYHNGAGKVTANTLASQTGGATAEDKYVYKGKTYWKDGTKRTGTMTVSSVVSFSVAATSYNSVTATWKWPGAAPYSGVIIRYKTGSYPTSVTDGTQGYKGTGTNLNLNASSTATISGLTQGTKYYFRIWVYATCSAGDVYSGYKEAAATTKPRGQQIFTSSGTFTVPANVTKIDVFCVGGGGGGGYTLRNSDSTMQLRGGGGGAGGYTLTKKNIAVTPNQKLAVTVGAGGKGGFWTYKDQRWSNTKAAAGGNSSVADIVVANGGGGCTNKYASGVLNLHTGGSGGSAGAGGWQSNGSANGADGYIYDSNRDSSYSCRGQLSTTKAFGETSGTLYAGGGGGGNSYNGDVGEGTSAGNGGEGGGGTTPHNIIDSAGQPGKANTGGGGSGGSIYFSHDGKLYGNYNAGGNGGSGIVIVRWGY
ncbi:MAG: fibronectin type III domain-containing protein [Lachnoclostridium edouardi]|uniref:fibronectin type III domain-containing protein n=1 Tax=Lachnoclostridium edouardi TaxID=1926283 RepID=UPI0026DA9517|nr:fibronectin type III domain-containing protein [Lachnoclostridium edouardi]MDO4277275.1 fibronectin type III domain-containing protein [Lachnoclostridium edouardi]